MLPTPAPAPSADQPRIIAVAGPLSGEVLPLNGAELTIGRDPSNEICLSDLSLSRRHCTITMAAPAPRIRDLGSSNGTFVNGMQISEQTLADGDRIQLGGSAFLFFARPAPAGDVHVSFTSGQPAGSTTRLRVEDGSYLQRRASDSDIRGSRRAQGLQALLTISSAVNATRREEDVHRLVLDHLAKIVPADRHAIVAADPDPGVVVTHGSGHDAATLDVNSDVLQQALEDRIAVLTRDAPSILCVPLATHGRTLGAIYLTASRPAAFDEEHLQLAAAIAGIASVAIDNARHVAALETETERLHSCLDIEHNLVGSSPRMNRVFELVKRVARADVTVLLTGETGTGKELVARAIHRNSPRGKRPFVAINCAALSETLLESELFGHERGAFTNAVTLKKGKLEVADGGTVFLDEVGELAPSLQSKLLRVLQEREFERIGGTRTIPIDVRVVSATNRVLSEEVAARRFRDDLYHRLNVVEIPMPPLRERKEDIARLAKHFIARFAVKVNRPVRGISGPALRCLEQYDWPGNVRELENAIERAIVLGSADEVLLEDLPEALLEGPAPPTDEGSRLHDAVRETKARVIREAFQLARRSYTDAAHILGVHPNYLHRLIRNLGIKADLDEAL